MTKLDANAELIGLSACLHKFPSCRCGFKAVGWFDDGDPLCERCRETHMIYALPLGATEGPFERRLPTVAECQAMERPIARLARRFNALLRGEG